MKLRAFVSLAIIVLAVSLFIVPMASAHNLMPRVEISLERLHPGEVVDVRGVSFGMEETVMLTLIGPGTEVALGEVVSDAEGGFLHIVVLPTDLAEGNYYFRAVTSHHYVLSPPLAVWGTAFMEGGGQGPRDEDDGLLAPMPTYPPPAQSASTAPAPIVPGPVETTAVSSGWGTNILLLAGLMALAILVVVALGKKRWA
jgi:hypothetical protein